MLFLRRQLLRTLSFAFGSSFIFGRNQLAIAAQIAVQPKTSPLPAGAAARDAIAEGSLRKARARTRPGDISSLESHF